MIKQAVLNYFKCLKHFFTPIGTLFLGILIGATVFLSGIVPAVNTVIKDINTLSADISLNFSELAETFMRIVRELDWSEPGETLSLILSKDWLSASLTKCLGTLLGINYQTYIESVSQIVMAFADTVIALAAIFAIFVIIGLMGGYFLTKFLVRRTIAKRSWWKVFPLAVLDSVLSTVAVVGTVLLMGIWPPSIILSPIALLLLFGVISFIEAYFAHGYKKIRFAEILNVKNIFLLIASNLIIIVTATAITVVALLLFKVLSGLVIGIALFEIAMLTANMNAESYVKCKVDAATGNPILSKASA